MTRKAEIRLLSWQRGILTRPRGGRAGDYRSLLRAENAGEGLDNQRVLVLARAIADFGQRSRETKEEREFGQSISRSSSFPLLILV
jgi:hypothetical protein